MPKGTLEIRFERQTFSVREASHFPDRKGIEQDDIVEVVIRCNVKKIEPELAGDGKWEMHSVLDAVEGRVLRIHKGAKPRRARRQSA